MNYKDAFLQAVDEYNSYGAACSNRKIQVEAAFALRLYGLKVSCIRYLVVFQLSVVCVCIPKGGHWCFGSGYIIYIIYIIDRVSLLLFVTVCFAIQGGPLRRCLGTD